MTSIVASLSAWLVPGLINGIWQGALIAFICAMILRLIRFSASTRCAAWFIVLLAVASLPLLPLRAAQTARSALVTLTAAAPVGPAGPSVPSIPSAAAGGILLLWAAGASAGLARLAVAWIRLSRIKRSAVPLPASPGKLPRGARICASDLCDSPVVVGPGRPVILFPSRMAFALAPAELNRILLHETAHVRRRDDWLQLAQRIIEALFFFHPAVRWIGRRLELEREAACDDHVVAADTARGAYARCLIRLAEMAAMPGASLPAPGVFSGSTQLNRRIHMLLESDRNRSVRVSGAGVVLVILLIAAGLFLFAQVSPVIAVADSDGKTIEEQKNLAENEARKARAEAARAQEMARRAHQEMLRASEEMKRTSEQAKRSAEEMQRQYERLRALAELSSREFELEAEALPAPAPVARVAPVLAAAPAPPATPSVAEPAPAPPAPMTPPVAAVAPSPESLPAPEVTPTPESRPISPNRPPRAPLPPERTPPSEAIPAPEAPEKW